MSRLAGRGIRAGTAERTTELFTRLFCVCARQMCQLKLLFSNFLNRQQKVASKKKCPPETGPVSDEQKQSGEEPEDYFRASNTRAVMASMAPSPEMDTYFGALLSPLAARSR